MQQPFYACDYAQEVGEQVAGTAPRTETWILLEYPRPWSAKAYEDSDIPADVKAYIDAQAQHMPFPRVQMIARNTRTELRDLSLYIIYAGWDTQRVRHFSLPGYEALLGLPLADIAAGTAPPDVSGQAIAAPVYIVCTNGKRDICCARHGLPLYNALRDSAGAHVWQCNHIGGHRFAGTCVVFPHGMYYGRLTPNDVPALRQAAEARTMLASHARGRACLEPPLQTAECFLHQSQYAPGSLDDHAPGYPAGELSVRHEDQRWEIDFARSDKRGAVQVVMTEETSSFDIISNSAEAQGKPGLQYRLASVRAVHT